MAKKSIILSNGDGRVTFSSTGSLWLEDSNMSISGSQVTASQIAFPNIPSDRLIYISGSRVTAVTTGSTNLGALTWNSETSAWSASADLVEDYIGSTVPGSDVSGTYGSAEGVKVINISNVNSGTLPVARGGTGLNIPVGSNILLKANSGSISYLSASAATSGSFLTAVNNTWIITPPAYLPDVRFYTSGSTGNTFTWNKPSGARFARVILQGAGGGGGSYGSATVSGAGGGSGGYTDIIINLDNITNAVTITIGLGALGGLVSNQDPPGGTTSFGSYYTANGGATSTSIGGSSANLGGAGGVGLTKNGSKGANRDVGSVGDPAYGMPSGGGSFGGTQGTVYPFFQNSKKNFGYTVDSVGNTIDITLSSGSAGSNGSTPLKPGYGAGGGGAQGVGIRGGTGGDGYALIISW